MNEQLYIESPFGLEVVHAETRYHEGWGWAWAVRLWDGHRWGTVDSGYAKSDRAALRKVAAALEDLADYERHSGELGESF